MLVMERHKKIIDTVNEKGSIRVTELSKMFNLTEETIRRDLEKLEQEGKLMRSHGGAVALQEEDTPYFQREMVNVKEKQKIADTALSFIDEGDSILLDASSTSWFLAKKLPNIPLTVITNSIRVTMELAEKRNIHVIGTGGNLSRTSLSFTGPLTIQTLDYYHADKAFISCKALHNAWGISDANDMQAMVKKKMLETADVNYLLIDHSKIGKKAISFVADFTNIQNIITDEAADESYLNELKSNGVKILF
ncbi:DeoR/GlpR family DNA-binding transcription regulator [Pseudogracilibacillus sp. SE30717A]|uniref:DeoR/GlpR family DNA-binding transcription regulator n=1 Tax=Pseudogracilibacillus sp. SE30717A TaxID=3098293 RepID=UPI00300DBFC8